MRRFGPWLSDKINWFFRGLGAGVGLTLFLWAIDGTVEINVFF